MTARRARLCAGSPDGTLIAKILTPAAIANAAFGGPDGETSAAAGMRGSAQG